MEKRRKFGEREVCMAYPASLIAYAFVYKGIIDGKFVTQMKLQKLVYFAHGYHLVKYGKPLINERFEAWKYGPVVPEIYHDFKLYGGDPIIDTLVYMPSYDNDKRPPVNEEAYDAINYTWDVLKDFTATRLSFWTHEPGSPWSKTFVPNKKSTPIPNEEIKKYFADFLIKQ